MIQFFPPTHKITIPKCKFYIINWETKTQLFFAVTVKIDFNSCIILFMKTVLLLVYVYMNCLL